MDRPGRPDAEEAVGGPPPRDAAEEGAPGGGGGEDGATVPPTGESGDPAAPGGTDAAGRAPVETTGRAGADGAERAGGTVDVADAGASPAADDVGPPGPPEVPIENREPGERPDASSVEEQAPLLLEAIRTGDASIALPFFFPADAFDLVKDLPDPRAYHRRMVRWFEEDVEIEHLPFRTTGRLEFERFAFGRCTWTAKGEEGNLLPYWSCRRNRLFARADGRPVQIEIRVMIHWGPRWHVVHLRPVRR